MKSIQLTLRNASVFALIVTVVLSSVLLPQARVQPPFEKGSAACYSRVTEPYILVGGQNGTWFQTTQWPKLYKIFLSDRSVTQLTPTPQPGAVWTGAWNGSQWLISGYGGANPGVNASNPFVYLYDGCSQIVADTEDLWEPQASWHGGDVFAASYNGSQWLLSGLGSDSFASGLPSFNHMTLGLFDGSNFTDLSSTLHSQEDEILYANAWNGRYWLVGGGYEGNTGVLFEYNGTNFTDLSVQLESVVPNFDSVQAIGWNGEYWLIGGVGFLAKYDGRNFMDLTPELDAVINPRSALNYTCCNSVTALAWNGASWMIGGGAPVAVPAPTTAWAVTYNDYEFQDLSSLLPSYFTNPAQSSSLLTITYVDDSWILGGYSDGRGILLFYTNSTTTDVSYLVKDSMSTVNWVGAGVER